MQMIDLILWPKLVSDESALNFGFSNVTWRPKVDNQAAGIVVGCKDVSIFVRVHQEVMIQ
jgi:hypothetical protein